MGNKGVKEKYHKQSSVKFLSLVCADGSADYKSHIKDFFINDLEGSEYEKFEFFKKIVDDND